MYTGAYKNPNEVGAAIIRNIQELKLSFKFRKSCSILIEKLIVILEVFDLIEKQSLEDIIIFLDSL